MNPARVASRHQGPESPEGTFAAAPGKIIWASPTMLQSTTRSFTQWSLTSGAQIVRNGHTDATTSNVIDIVYHNHTLFQVDTAPNWRYWNTSTSDSTPGIPGWVFYNLAGPIALSTLNYQAGAVAGSIVATISVPLTANAAGDTFPGVFGGTLTLAGADAANFVISGTNLVVAAGHTLSSGQPLNITITAQVPVGTFNIGKQLGPTGFTLTQASQVESIEGFNVTTVGPIVFASQTMRTPSSGPFNQFALNSSGQATLGGNPTTGGAGSSTVALVYHFDTCFEENAAGSWWYWNTSTSDATAGTPGWVFYNLLGPITLSTQQYSAGATAGTVVATVNVPLSSNAAGDTFPGVWGGTLTLSGSDAANFTISGTNLVVAAGHTLSSSGQVYNITISAQTAVGTFNIGKQLGPTGFALSQAQTESAEAFSVTAAGTNIFASRTNRVASSGPFNVWALTAPGGQITLDTGSGPVVQTVTSNVIALVYHNHSLFQENSTPEWWYWNTSTSDTTPGTPGWTLFNLLGPITLSTLNYTSGATAGTTVATISVPMSTNAAGDTFFNGLWGATLTLAGADAANFVISGSNLNVAAGHTLSTTNQTYNITISAQVPVGTFNIGTQIAATPFALQAVGSVTNTVATTPGPVIVDSSNNHWTLVLSSTSGYQVAFNGAPISFTSGVVELAYVAPTVWQLNSAGNWFSFNVVNGVPGTASGPTTTSPLPAGAVPVASARSVTNSFAVETQMKYATEIGSSSPYFNATNVLAALDYLQPLGRGTGVNLVRETLLDNQPFNTLLTWGADGYKFCMGYFYAQQSNNANPTDQQQKINTMISDGYVKWVEAPNEVNGFGPYTNPTGQYFSPTGTTYAAGAPSVAGYQIDTWNFFHSSTVNVARWTIGDQSTGLGLNNNALQQALTNAGFSETQVMNAGNVHCYTASGHCPTDPGGSGDYLGFQVTQNVGDTTALGLPYIITETGLIDINTNGKFGNSYVNACYHPQIWLHFFKAGCVFATIYEMFNYTQNDGTQETHFGLWDANGFPKGSAVSLRNMLQILSDTGANAVTYAPKVLTCNVTGLQSPGEWMAVQRSDGTNIVVIWPNVTIFLNGTYTAAPVYNLTVSLGATFATTATYDILQNAQSTNIVGNANWVANTPAMTPIATASNVSSVTVTMGDSVKIVTFK